MRGNEVPLLQLQYISKKLILTHFVNLNVLEEGCSSLISEKKILLLSDFPGILSVVMLIKHSEGPQYSLG